MIFWRYAGAYSEMSCVFDYPRAVNIDDTTLGMTDAALICFPTSKNNKLKSKLLEHVENEHPAEPFAFMAEFKMHAVE
jgi:hypothetical protein